jgi:hypothetical protein
MVELPLGFAFHRSRARVPGRIYERLLSLHGQGGWIASLVFRKKNKVASSIIGGLFEEVNWSGDFFILRTPFTFQKTPFSRDDAI